MPKKSLLETNAYLRDPKKREAFLLISAWSSVAIEGVRIPKSVRAKIAKLLRSLSQSRPTTKPARSRR